MKHAWMGILLFGMLPAHAEESSDLSAWWADLGDADAMLAYKAVWAFTRAPGQTLVFFEKHLQPALAPDKKRVEALISDLSSDLFATRNKANSELEKLGDLAAPTLREVITRDKLALEARQRVMKLLKNLDGPVTSLETLRAIRAVEALEYIGTLEARKLLDRLAQGAAGARLTVEAQQALGRMKR